MRIARIGTVALLLGLLLNAPARGETPFNVQGTMHDNLAVLQAAKKPVTIVLKNGDKYQATIGALGDHFVVLTQPAQKEFFDVLVPIDEITAVEARARDH